MAIGTLLLGLHGLAVARHGARTALGHDHLGAALLAAHPLAGFVAHELPPDLSVRTGT